MDQLVEVLLDTASPAMPVVRNSEIEKLVGHFYLLVEVALHHSLEYQLAEAHVQLCIDEVEEVALRGMQLDEVTGECPEVKGQMLTREDMELRADAMVDRVEDDFNPILLNPQDGGFEILELPSSEQPIEKLLVVV